MRFRIFIADKEHTNKEPELECWTLICYTIFVHCDVEFLYLSKDLTNSYTTDSQNKRPTQHKQGI